MTGVARPAARTGDWAGVVAGAGPLLRRLTTLPGRPDDGVAVVNGLFGDALDDQGSSLATPKTIRAGATVLPLERDAAIRSISPPALGGSAVMMGLARGARQGLLSRSGGQGWRG